MRAQDILADHVNEVEINATVVRKGTVGAFLANARALHEHTTPAAARDSALRDIEQALPALRALGLFDVLEIRDPWLRAFVQARA